MKAPNHNRDGGIVCPKCHQLISHKRWRRHVQGGRCELQHERAFNLAKEAKKARR